MHRVHSSAAKDVRFSASNVHLRPDIGTMHAQAGSTLALSLALALALTLALLTLTLT